MPGSLGSYFPEQFILKITLAGSEPKIWRRVEVHSGLTLDDLHYVIQSVFAWDNEHLDQFLAPPGGKLTQKAMRQAIRYHVLPHEPVFGMEIADRPADQSLVGEVLSRDQKLIIYEYDFGDSWEHLVKVEKRSPGGDQSHVPICLAGENAAPLEDMGGIYDYYDWLEVLHDPTRDMHEEAVEWFGKDFDPARFDLDEANRQLRAVFKPVPKARKPKR